ncbi:conserved hypothetical protein [Luminiphilus syltensis NOR5-1B]|uniref:DUF1315 domain-containing protein n=2 Tax=Luminiphilus TaxID=1341118 RepID=B8KXW3_9GAMM|nr:conserved hypothetical protein [Luminiphilus syltensis NOR5-1B]
MEAAMTDPYRDTIATMDRSVYDRLVDALATGRWPDGKAVTASQREHAMGAVIAWGELHLPEADRIGFIDKGHKGGGREQDVQPLTLQGESK